MAIDTNVQAFSDEELLKLWRKAYAELADRGVSYAVSGRTLTRNDARAVREQIEFLEERVKADAPGNNGGTALIRYSPRGR